MCLSACVCVCVCVCMCMYLCMCVNVLTGAANDYIYFLASKNITIKNICS